MEEDATVSSTSKPPNLCSEPRIKAPTEPQTEQMQPPQVLVNGRHLGPRKGERVHTGRAAARTRGASTLSLTRTPSQLQAA